MAGGGGGGWVEQAALISGIAATDNCSPVSVLPTFHDNQTPNF